MNDTAVSHGLGGVSSLARSPIHCLITMKLGNLMKNLSARVVALVGLALFASSGVAQTSPVRPLDDLFTAVAGTVPDFAAVPQRGTRFSRSICSIRARPG